MFLRRTHLWIAPRALAAGAAAVAACAGTSGPAQFLRSRDVYLELQAGTPAVDAVAYLSRDNTTSWSAVELARVGDATYCFSAPSDGEYAFHFALRSETGAADEAPSSGFPPDTTVVIDTVAPLLQFRELSIGGDADDPTAYGRVALIENDEADVRLFYRTAESRSWRDAGLLALVAGRFAHPLPRTAGATIDLCVVATDRAGNTARDERIGLWLPPRVVPQSSIAAEAAGPAEGAAPAAVAARAEDVDVVGDEPQIRGSGSAGPAARGGVRGAEDVAAEVEQLRTAAADFAAQGRHALAAARWQDALRLAPADAGLLSGLGKSEYELGHYAAASQSFEAVLKAAPDHAGALEGLALVAATQHQYPAARETLLRLLERQPGVARNWLNYGDVEYRLGNVGPAQAAWEKAARQPDADLGIRAGVQRRLTMIAPSADAGRGAKRATEPPGTAPRK